VRAAGCDAQTNILSLMPATCTVTHARRCRLQRRSWSVGCCAKGQAHADPADLRARFAKEADAFAWAVAKGADVISCSWGPEDGVWWDPSDPLHREVTPLPDSTRLAIRHAVTNGRGGEGCVIFWAAGTWQ
jgi:hypothetical protein